MNDKNIAAALIAANHKLAIQHKEIELRAAELILAKIELQFQNEEKENRSFELIRVNNKLKKAELYQKEYKKGLEEIIHIVSHKVRHPICQILGITNLIGITNSKVELKTMNCFIKQSAQSLDFLTKDLSKLINRLKNKGTIGTKKAICFGA